MKFKRFPKDGSADIIFEEHEKNIIYKTGKLHNDNIKGIQTKPNQDVKTEESKDDPKVYAFNKHTNSTRI
jgi:hypothetical protein